MSETKNDTEARAKREIEQETRICYHSCEAKQTVYKTIPDGERTYAKHFFYPMNDEVSEDQAKLYQLLLAERVKNLELREARPDDNPFRICYLRCDPDYEVVPHIHAPEGLITVSDEIDRMNFDGCKVVVVSDVRSVTEINGKLEILFQACFECKTRWIGSQNYAHCPNCGKMMVHVTEGK